VGVAAFADGAMWNQAIVPACPRRSSNGPRSRAHANAPCGHARNGREASHKKISTNKLMKTRISKQNQTLGEHEDRAIRAGGANLEKLVWANY
jgi:hypothetical protein